MPSSIRWRLVGAFALTAIFSVVAVGAIALALVAGSTERRQEQHALANAEAVAKEAHSLVVSRADPAELGALARASAFIGASRVRILSADGRPLADSGPGGSEDRLAVMAAPAPPRLGAVAPPPVVLHLGPLDDRAAEGAMAVVRRIQGVAGPQLAFETSDAPASPAIAFAASGSARGVKVQFGQAQAPLGFVELSGGPDLKGEALRSTGSAFATAAVAAAVAAMGLALVLARSLTSPLSHLAGVAGRMAAGDLGARAEPSGGREIEAVARHFNRLADSLQRTVRDLEADRDALRRFVADASHELRTPITALRTYNTLLADDALDTDARAEFVRDSAAQLERLEWITGDLLDLSRLDAGVAALDVADVDLAELVARVGSMFAARAAQRGVLLRTEPPPAGCTVRGDRARLAVAISNLLDNALRYAPRDTEVSLTVAEGAGRAIITVADAGPGIDPVDLPRVFDRFFRGRPPPDESDPAGTGLGLALVKSIVEAHGGNVEASSGQGGGGRLAIALPTGVAGWSPGAT